MLRLLQWLLFGHVHKWVEKNRMRLDTDFGAVGVRVISECEHCGKFRKFDLV